MKSLDDITRINRQAALERTWIDKPVTVTFLSGRTAPGKVTIVKASNMTSWVTLADGTGLSVPITKLVLRLDPVPPLGFWQRVKTWLYQERGNHYMSTKKKGHTQ